MKKNILLTCFLTGVCLLNATIIKVPANYSTIQAAILASSNGDTVEVDPGTYFENINFRGRKIVLTSKYYLAYDTSYICSTIINGSLPVFADTASCIILNHNEDSTTIIQGFTITGGKGTKWLDVHGAGTYREGGAIITEFSSPVIRWNYIKNNFVTNANGVAGTGGGGIRCGDGKPKIYNNVLSFNKAGYGGGIVSNYCNGIEIKNNLVVNNSGGQNYGGGGIWATGTNTNTKVYVENNTIANNHVMGTSTFGGKGGAIFVFAITLETKNNIVFGNTQTSGNSIRVFSGGSVNATYSDIDFVYPGTGNINQSPAFADTINYGLSPLSPCIDAGDILTSSNDLTITVNTAKYPSQGTERNDMGAYGGPLANVFGHCPLLATGISNGVPGLNYTVYPVPANNVLFIEGTSISQVELSDLSGTIILQDTNPGKTLDVSNLSNGTFLLYARFADGTVSVKKVIILR